MEFKCVRNYLAWIIGRSTATRATLGVDISLAVNFFLSFFLLSWVTNLSGQLFQFVRYIQCSMPQMNVCVWEDEWSRSLASPHTLTKAAYNALSTNTNPSSYYQGSITMWVGSIMGSQFTVIPLLTSLNWRPHKNLTVWFTSRELIRKWSCWVYFTPFWLEIFYCMKTVSDEYTFTNVKVVMTGQPMKTMWLWLIVLFNKSSTPSQFFKLYASPFF